ncbi:MAG: hypothetical protein ABFD97_07485 [Syntrophobacter sp.]
MYKKLLSLTILGIVFTLVFGFGSVAKAEFFDRTAPGVDRDLFAYHQGEVNQFGNDRAYSSAGGTDTDADFRANHFVPDSYGLSGSYADWMER